MSIDICVTEYKLQFNCMKNVMYDHQLIWTEYYCSICDVHRDKGSFWNVLSVVLSRNMVGYIYLRK